MRLHTLGGLWIENPGADPDAAPGGGPRPRPLALLAILAAAGAGGMSRTRVMGVLWPDTEAERARHALSQTLYSIRRDLGADVVLTAPTLRLDAERITSDVADFRAAVAAKDWPAAAALYGGPFLDHFHLADAPEFERWAEAERAALATAAIRAIEIVAKACAEAGHREEAAEHWHRLARLDPVDARIAASYMKALATLGDRAAALAHGRAHAELLRRELDAEPNAVVERLMASLRELESTEAHAVPTAASVASVASAESVEPAGDPALARRATLLVAGFIAFVLVASLAWRTAVASRRTTPPILAVGTLHDLTAPDSVAHVSVLREMLATSLARVAELQVVANSRMLELTPREADTSRSALSDAARRAGATEIVEGELIPLSNGQLRLEVRRVDLARGLVRGGYRVTGTDRIALFDSVTALIAADLRVGAPVGTLAAPSRHSPIAHRFFDEGPRALYQYDASAAYPLFAVRPRRSGGAAVARGGGERRALGGPLPRHLGAVRAGP